MVNRLEDVARPDGRRGEGHCLGGGLALAAVCDLRVATRSVPVRRADRAHAGQLPVDEQPSRCWWPTWAPPRTLDLLLRARLLDADEAHAAGFVAEVCDDGELDAALEAVVGTLLAHAPLTMWATKPAVARLRRASAARRRRPGRPGLRQRRLPPRPWPAFGSGSSGRRWQGR